MASRESTKLPINTYLQPLSIMALLYPFDRIHSNMQIKATYASQQVASCDQFFTRCTHYGIRSWYRGLGAHMIRVTSTYSIFHLMANASNFYQTQNNFLPYLGLALSYLLVYPFDNIRLRLGADIERIRVYRGVRDCIDKMRKIEGSKSFYRGFSLALPHLLLQYGLCINLYEKMVEENREKSNFSLPYSDTGIPQFMIAYMASEFLLYPIDSLKKLVQINGAMSHDNITPRYRDALKLHKMGHFLRGLPIRMMNGLVYTGCVLGIGRRDRE